MTKVQKNTKMQKNTKNRRYAQSLRGKRERSAIRDYIQMAEYYEWPQVPPQVPSGFRGIAVYNRQPDLIGTVCYDFSARKNGGEVIKGGIGVTALTPGR